MKKAIVFGLGYNYEKYKKLIPSYFDVEIIAITDNDINKHGIIVDGFTVIAPEKIRNIEFDIIIITPSACEQIINQLRETDVPLSKIEVIKSQLTWLTDMSEWIDFKDKNVLEIGCGNGDLLKAISKCYNPKYVTGIDLMLSEWWGIDESEGTNWCVKDGNAEALDFTDNSFDIVYSIATFEHIKDLEKALKEIERVLKPGGRFYTSFSPIWTSVVGHHFVEDSESTWNLEHLSLIPPWGHLYMTEKEMEEHLILQNISKELSEQILNFVYSISIINRLSRIEIVNYIINSGMIICKLSENISFNRNVYFKTENQESELTADILEKIKMTKYKASDLGVVGLTVVLEKYKEFKV